LNFWFCNKFFVEKVRVKTTNVPELLTQGREDKNKCKSCFNFCSHKYISDGINYIQLGEDMASPNYPYQPMFSIQKEDWGGVKLSDGSVLDVRFVLADLIVTSEDLLGAQALLNHTVVVRARASPELIKELANAPLAPDTPIPMTKEEGFEKVEVQAVEKPIQSSYSFETKSGKYTLFVEVNIQSVVRNKKFKTLNGSPIYRIRWTVNYKIAKV
jgi:hypothetical protein